MTQEGDRLLFDGPVTIATVSALLAQARALLAPGASVLDFRGVTEVDSAAVALALECLREARRRKLALSLANLPEAMQNLAELYAVSELLQADPA
ncbi:MAG: STAS domain-containing protein [Betaproteobacteria bacterium]|nr:MAG: STAS domain-containing protein [Betaproteobacteria bacterium]